MECRGKWSTSRQLVFLGHFAYTGKRLLARVTAKAGTTTSSVMPGSSSLRLGCSRDGQAEGGRWAAIEGEDRSDFLRQGRKGGARGRAVDDVWLLLLFGGGERDDGWLTSHAGIVERGIESARTAEDGLRKQESGGGNRRVEVHGQSLSGRSFPSPTR